LEKYGKNREFRFQTRAALKRVKVDIDKLVEYSNGRKASTPFIFCKKPEDSANHAKARMMGKGKDPATGSANGCFLVYRLVELVSYCDL
jgi:predicted PhzF superfamily epimerase YddE/YHI9